jgi:hypothetical protein
MISDKNGFSLLEDLKNSDSYTLNKELIELRQPALIDIIINIKSALKENKVTDSNKTGFVNELKSMTYSGLVRFVNSILFFANQLLSLIGRIMKERENG